MRNVKPLKILFVIIGTAICLYAAFMVVIYGALAAWSAGNNMTMPLYYLAALLLLLGIYPIIKLSKKIQH